MGRWSHSLRSETAPNFGQNGQIEQNSEVAGDFAQIAQIAQAAEQRVEVDAAEFGERAAIVEHDGGFPRAWADGFARLDPNRSPAGVPLKRWRRFVDDVGLFLDRWAGKAAALGWGPEDLFGAHPQKPFERIDYLGLLWLLNGARIVALTGDAAAIETAGGARQSCRRKPHVAGRFMAWELMR